MLILRISGLSKCHNLESCRATTQIRCHINNERYQVDKVSISSRSNRHVTRDLLSIKSFCTRYNVYLGLIAVSVMLLGFASGITASPAESIATQPVGICDRTDEVAEVIVAEVQNTRPEATCAEIIGDDLASIEGPSSSRLQHSNLATSLVMMFRRHRVR